MVKEIFGMIDWRYVIAYVLGINLVAFLMMYFDKQKAKKGQWRIPENTLFTVVLFGGGFGGIAGMYKFRHKTQKLRFTIGFPVILITEIVLILYVVFKYVIFG